MDGQRRVCAVGIMKVPSWRADLKPSWLWLFSGRTRTTGRHAMIRRSFAEQTNPVDKAGDRMVSLDSGAIFWHIKKGEDLCTAVLHTLPI